MTPQQHLQVVREAVINAGVLWWMPDKKGIEPERPIRLADVLLAIDKFGNYCIAARENGTFMVYGDDCEWRANGKLLFWNLRKDSLEDQSPECLEFLANLLAVEK